MRLLLALCFVSAMVFAQQKTTNGKDKTVYDFAVKDINGKDVNLKQYAGKILVIVNTASHCGYTPQYKGLEELYNKYKDEGVVVLGFPCNDFGAQEPGSNEEIKNFCSTNYQISFPLFDKVAVLGKDKSPLYSYLLSADPAKGGDIKWNFEKFVVDQQGKVVARYRSKVTPLDSELEKTITGLLGK